MSIHPSIHPSILQSFIDSDVHSSIFLLFKVHVEISDFWLQTLVILVNLALFETFEIFHIIHILCNLDCRYLHNYSKSVFQKTNVHVIYIKHLKCTCFNIKYLLNTIHLELFSSLIWEMLILSLQPYNRYGAWVEKWTASHNAMVQSQCANILFLGCWETPLHPWQKISISEGWWQITESVGPTLDTYLKKKTLECLT